MKRQGFPVEGTQVAYYSSVLSAFVKCAEDPIGDYVHVSESDLEIINDSPSLRLRFENPQQLASAGAKATISAAKLQIADNKENNNS